MLFWLTIVLSSIAVQVSFAQFWNPSHAIGTISGNYNFSYNQTPDQLVELHPAVIPNTGLLYQWEQSFTPTDGFTAIAGATQTNYIVPAPLNQTTYYRRKTIYPSNSGFIYSNVIKIKLVSQNWEDRNYIREHNIITTGVTTWLAVDQLPVGSKLQTTTYLDGLGRSLQKISRETATPANPNDTWGDVVQFFQYDQYGRQPLSYLPYTTSSQSGKYKTASPTEQPQYYTSKYNESPAYSSAGFDNSPLNRIINAKAAGTAWAASAGNSITYTTNTLGDDVKVLSVDYIQGNPPFWNQSSPTYGSYPDNSLLKTISTDENGKQVIVFANKYGQQLLKKVQLDDNPSGPYTGWICTYYVYDDFGLLRVEIQPEAVNYLANNSWTFSGTTGTQVFNNLCFQYHYDEKGRMTWKKTPGAEGINMIYDARDRLVFTQDGNQASPSPQWTATIYDELDRPVLSTLYNTTKTIAELKTDIASAAAKGTITVNNTANTGGPPITLNTSFNPLSATDLNTTSVTTVLNYLFYDHHSFPGVQSFNTGYTNLSAYSNSDPNVQVIATNNRTLNFITGSRTRVLESNNFLSATNYYDVRGSLIQTSSTNIRSGTDVTTVQYHFDGRALSSCTDHTNAGAGYTNFKILTKNIFDKLARVTSIQKQFGSNALKTVASYDFDDMGRLKTKHLDPGYTGSGGTELESLNYSFNINGLLTGINKDYALKTPGNYSKWGHFFGMYLGYDNRDNAFASARLNGQLTGVIWNTQGDDAQRKYNYTYDNAGRLTEAAFNEQQHPGEGWANNKMDFSVSGYSGQISYDLNGNLLSMLQKGVMPGTTAPITVDDLRYTYQANSNKLQDVKDWMAGTSVNGMFGDLKDGGNGSSPDYVYDNNGNVVIDLNKNAKDLNNQVGANGIRYNFLDKPDLIRIAGKGTITIVYSANGGKLQRIFTPESATATTTTYINQFVYQAAGSNPDVLSFIQFEEGRVRAVTPTSQNNGYDALTVDGNLDLPNGKKGVYDYFLLDYQQNVRMVLSEEVRVASNTATMETTRASVEEPIFGQVGTGNEVAVTRYPAGNTGWTGNATGSVSRLGNLAGQNIGPNTLQKVMAGDVVLANAQYYYEGSAGGSNNGFVNNVLQSLLQALTNGPASELVKGGAGNVTSQLNLNPGFATAVQPPNSNGGPLAYLTVLFFDERFNFIPEADGGAYRQQVAASVTASGASLTLTGLKAPKNGYCYIYVSNQSDQAVYFDNLAVTISQGNIIEENHYYSFGLRIASISSKKYSDAYDGHAKNDYQMQGAFSEMDDDIGWNDFALRNYDPQTGRFVQQDPFQQFSSPYVGMGNDPINMIDPSGGIGIPCPGTSALSIFLDNAVYAVGNAFNSVSNVIAVAGRISSVTTTSMSMVNAVNTSKIINGQINTLPVGEIEANKAYNGTISEEDNNEINTNKNVMIFILTEQEYKRWNPALNKNDDLHKAWDIIYATNIVDATRFFKSKYGSEKVNNLLFITHGNEGGIVYSFKGQARGINSKEMNQYANGEGAKLESNDLTAIEKLKYLVGQVKNGGNFVLGRCASSDGIQSEGFLRGLNNVATNPINLISNKAKITRPLHWDNKFGYYGPSWNSSNGKIWIQIDYNNKIHRNLDLKYNRDQEPAIFYN